MVALVNFNIKKYAPIIFIFVIVIVVSGIIVKQIINTISNYKTHPCQFLHNPKTGGTSLKNYIKDNFDNTCLSFHAHHDRPTENPISIIRDPVKRFKSAIKYVLKNGHDDRWNNISNKHQRCYDFLNSKTNISDLFGDGHGNIDPTKRKKFESVCLFDDIFHSQQKWTKNSKLLCYEKLDNFNNFIEENCGCTTDADLIPNTNDTHNMFDEFFNNPKLLRKYVNLQYKKDVEQYKNTCLSNEKL